MPSQDQATGASQSPSLPLFYRDPVPLSGQLHSEWRLIDGDVGFAADTPYIPLVLAEIAAASRDYPVVFTTSDAHPIAVLGLERVNLFVEDGRWDASAYVPAYVRRYPFAFMSTREPNGFCLAIDAASERVAREGEAGAVLFEGDAPSPMTRQALEFCAAFGRDATATEEFARALKAHDLLIDRRADATLPDGRKFGLQGFQIIDREKLAALDDVVVLAWHRAGYLSLIYFHLASLDRFSALLARQAARLGAQPPSGSVNGAAKTPKKKA
jgi:hypothetical protein